MSEQILTFDNARALSDLYASDESLLRETETLLGVKLISRDAILKIEGAESAVLLEIPKAPVS